MNRSKRANHFGTPVEKRMATKATVRTRAQLVARRQVRQRHASRDQIDDARAFERAARNWKVYREYHEKLRRHDGWYCFVVYRPHGRPGLTILQDKMVRSCNLPLLRWHGGGDRRGTQQAKIPIGDRI
ncbi:hypothetical protein C483_14095 [Natrialba hulunbeirensis JCM 10989]|uniref:Uncharacterized protein n=1 Tax=Natrialba hulunbeirensis JCM 10989 TaxID=1227493 RepID=L9ZVA2_9EURY|nr:hypothetical protein C483_14095 [Natrialba hulunbeirensis JCM 10989]